MKPNGRTLVTAISFLLIGIIATSIWVYAQPTTTFTISGGVYPSEKDYTFWREGSTYFTKDRFGVIPSWGENTNVTAIYEQAHEAGDSMHFTSGTYEVGTEMRIEHQIEVSGVYGGVSGGTVFKPMGDNNIFQIDLDEQYQGVYLHDFSFIDSDTNQNATGAIFYETSGSPSLSPRDLILENLCFRYVYYGFFTPDYGGGAVLQYPHAKFSHLEFMDIRGSAIRLQRVADVFMSDIEIDNANTVNEYDLVHLEGSAVGITIDGMYILGNNGSGMIENAQLNIDAVVVFINNLIVDTTPLNTDGIWIGESSYHVYISNFLVTNADDYGIVGTGRGGTFLSQGSVAGSGLAGIGWNSAHNHSGEFPVHFSNVWAYDNLYGFHFFGVNQTYFELVNCRAGDVYFGDVNQDYGLRIAQNQSVYASDCDFRNNELMGISGDYTSLRVRNSYNDTWIDSYP